MADDQYESVEECLADIQLIWDNCKLYNTEDSPIYKLALSMEAHAAKLTADLFGVLKKKVPQLEAQKPKERDHSASPESANQDFNGVQTETEAGRIGIASSKTGQVHPTSSGKGTQRFEGKRQRKRNRGYRQHRTAGVRFAERVR